MNLQKKGSPTKNYKNPPKVLKVFLPKPSIGFSLKNFKLAVNFNPELEKKTCTNTWSRDIYSNHIRNKRLLDLPFPKPHCCMEVYNVTLDRLKLNKLKKFNMTRPVRSYAARRQRALALQESKPPRMSRKSVPPPPSTVIFPECYIVVESSDSEDSLMIEENKEEPESRCTVCRSPEKRRKLRRFTRLVRQMSRNAVAICKDVVKEEISTHKWGTNLKLKLKKVF